MLFRSPGPIFANVVLADEINRATPKTQSALLEAMQERRVTVGRKTHVLPDPFQVFATRNPIEQEGTYPLPEAQLDRFLLEIHVEYPSEAQEREIARRTTSGPPEVIEPVLARWRADGWHARRRRRARLGALQMTWQTVSMAPPAIPCSKPSTHWRRMAN